MSERDNSTSSANSPYDETTGQIPTQRTPQPDRDDFYARHARRPAGEMSRVDELDDLDPDDVATRPVAAPPPSAPPAREPATPTPDPPAATPLVTGEPSEPSGDEAAATVAFAAPETVAPAPTERIPTDPIAPTPGAEPFAYPAVAAPDEGEPPRRRFGRSRRSEFSDDEVDEAVAKARRGTLDLGLLLLRLAVGSIAMAHGLQKLFGWWSGPRLSGFEAMLVNGPNPDIGFNPDYAQPLAIVGALSECIGGLMVILGLLTPVGASAILGTMLVAAAFKITLLGGFTFFAAAGGVEYELMLAAAAAAIILTGPGLYSLDYPRGWARRPFVGSVLWLIIGIAAAVAIWIVFNGTNPFNSPGNPPE